MRVVFLGSPPFATPVLRSLLTSEHQVLALVTPPDRPKGRGRGVVASELVQQARQSGVPVFQPHNLRETADVDRLRSFDAEVLCVASYGEILRREVLELAPHGALNVHASLLPRWRGASPIQSAIAAGDRQTGVSVQRMVLALDEGDVILSRATAIGAQESAGELLQRLAELGGRALVEALDAIESNDATFTPQDPEAATHCRKLTKAHGHLDWNRPAIQLERQVRAMDPWPGARTTLPDGRSLVVRSARVCEATDGNTPHTEPGRWPGGTDLRVMTGEGMLLLERVQPQGKGIMESSAFLRGARLEPGARFGIRPEDEHTG